MCVLHPRKAPTPGGGVARAVAAECVFKRLVGSFCLSVRLRMISRREADRGPNSPTKVLPHLRGELRTTVRYNVLGDTVQTDNVESKQIGHLCCRREFRERNVVDRLGEPVHYSQDGVATFGRRESRDEVHGNVRPGTARNVQGVKKAGWSSVLVLIAGADVTGGDEGLDVRVQARPPEATADELRSSGSTRMTGESVGVAPGEYLGAEMSWNKQGTRRIPTRTGFRL